MCKLLSFFFVLVYPLLIKTGLALAFKNHCLLFWFSDTLIKVTAKEALKKINVKCQKHAAP